MMRGGYLPIPWTQHREPQIDILKRIEHVLNEVSGPSTRLAAIKDMVTRRLAT